MDDLSVTPMSIKLGIVIEVSCVNPNPYGIEIVDTNPGAVYVGHNRRWEVGKLKVLTGSRLHQKGSGKIRVRMQADISGEKATEMAPHFLEDRAVPVEMELQFNVGVSVSFGLGSWQTHAPFKKACGMNMAGLLVNQFIRAEDEGVSSRLGPLVCREHFGFELPPVGGPRSDSEMKFSAAQVAPNEVRKGETIKNLSLGFVIFGSLLAALTLFYGAWRSLHGDSLPAWPPSPSRQLSCPEPNFRTLAGEPNDQEMGEVRLLGGSPRKLALGGSPIKGGESPSRNGGSPSRLPRTPQVPVIREDLSEAAEEAARRYSGSPARLRSPDRYRRGISGGEMELGLPQSPTMLSSLASGEHNSPGKRSPLKKAGSLLGAGHGQDDVSSCGSVWSPPRNERYLPPFDEGADKHVPLIGTHMNRGFSQGELSPSKNSPSKQPPNLRNDGRRHTTTGLPPNVPFSPCPSRGSQSNSPSKSPTRLPPRSSPSYEPPGGFSPSRSPSPTKK